jgi:hypothetical protein
MAKFYCYSAVLKDHVWLVVDLPLWKIMEFVSWDDDIPNWMESHKIHEFIV